MSKEHKVISVDYKLFRDTIEGEMIDASQENEPLVFMTNMNQMIPAFEEKVSSLNVSEDFSFGIDAENAYGSRSSEGIVEIPQDIFMKEGKLAEEVVIGNVLPLQDGEGHTHQAKVESINEKTITVDLNHPLADQNLFFTGKVVEVRAATTEEVEHGHVHGPGGHQH